MKAKKMKSVWLLRGPFTQYVGGTDKIRELADENNLRVIDSRYVDGDYPNALDSKDCPKVELKNKPKQDKKSEPKQAETKQA